MNILVINCGSSSIKYKLYGFPAQRIIAKGLIERIGESSSAIKTHSQGIKELFSSLIRKKAISNLNEISAIGHRVVHGGEDFREPHLIDGRVIKKIREYFELAPLHNPVNLAGILGCREVLPKVSQVAVFDTAFHHSMPDYAYRYALPDRAYSKYRIRRYGFHGTSHQFVAHKAAQELGKPLRNLKLIICHLGNGCSITAVNKGKSVDTSMGFTPLEGLMMGTRSGDVDVAAVFHFMEKEKLSVHEMDAVLNRQSGFLGVSGISNDLRVILKADEQGDRRARLAIEMFLYRIKKYIGAYYLILGGADAVCFTAGIGENNPEFIRRMKKDISRIASRKTKVLVIPTDEELMIASLTYKVITKKK